MRDAALCMHSATMQRVSWACVLRMHLLQVQLTEGGLMSTLLEEPPPRNPEDTLWKNPQISDAS
jgi:hypothetical protein